MGNLPFRQIHLDFHTSECIENIGSKFDKKQFQDMLKLGHVNSITIFSKCHHGWAYHSTEANVMHPHLNFELLDKMIEACKEINVQTPIYISAGLDQKIAREHPEWLYRNRDESISWGTNFEHANYLVFCFNTPYLDVLTKQAEEVARRYDVPGLFLDITSPKPCYCQHCIKSMRDKGLDPYDAENVNAHAELVFANYCKTINDAVHKIRPNMRVFHNGGHIVKGDRVKAHYNTHLELESLPTGGWGYDHFPLSVRYAVGLGMEYLGMTGKFHLSWGEFGGFKHPNALRYEAALNIANGSKCSIGDQMHPLGFLDKATYELIGAAYSEVEAKEQWCDDVESIADIGVFAAEIQYNEGYKEIDSGFSRILNDCKYLYDIIDEETDFSKYKVIILPDNIIVAGVLKKKLDRFIKDGGKILASNMSCVDNGKFIYDLGAFYESEAEFSPDYIIPGFELPAHSTASFVLYNKGQKISATDNKNVLAQRQDSYFNRSTFAFCSHQHTPNDLDANSPGMTKGSDGIYIAWPVFKEYGKIGRLIARDIVQYALNTLLDDKKTLKTNLPIHGTVTLMKQPDNNRYVNHLLYATPVKRGEVEVVEDLIPLNGIKIEVLIPEKVKRVYSAPDITELAFVQDSNGRISVDVPTFECHTMIVFDY